MKPDAVLASTAEKDGYHYLMVMMGAPQYDSNGEKLEENMVFKQTIELYDWAFQLLSPTRPSSKRMWVWAKFR